MQHKYLALKLLKRGGKYLLGVADIGREGDEAVRRRPPQKCTEEIQNGTMVVHTTASGQIVIAHGPGGIMRQGKTD